MAVLKCFEILLLVKRTKKYRKKAKFDLLSANMVIISFEKFRKITKIF